MREDIFNHHFGEGLRVMWLRWLAQAEHPDDAQAQAKALESWLPGLPEEWSHPPAPGVGLRPGLRVTLSEAHQRLQMLVNKAKVSPPPQRAESESAATKMESQHWIAVTELAEIVLNAVPHDPVALACLAEVEHAHGHTEFAVTYLRYATEAMKTLV